MRFANLYWTDSARQGTAGASVSINIGDILQFMVFDYIYETYIPEAGKIVRLRVDELADYRGEKLILPMNWSLLYSGCMIGDRITISDDIIPVFLGMTELHYKEEDFNADNIAYIKQYSPVGCRDASTQKLFQKFGIQAYLNGCMTSVFPKRAPKESQKKVFFVDAPAGLRKYVPDQLWDNYEIMTQQYYVPNDMPLDELLEKIRMQYRKYADEASLVVTSRLHVASPCMAMGIPVIFAKDEIDIRFSWIDKYLPLYDRAHYSEIDWSPKAVDYEKNKQIIIQNAVSRIRGTYEKYALSEAVDEIYRDRPAKEYASFSKVYDNNIGNAISFLRDRFQREDRFTYSFWGVCNGSENLYQWICTEYPNAVLKSVIDTYKDTEFHGIRTVKPDSYQRGEGEVILVVPVKASNAAAQVFRDKGIGQEWYACCGDLFLEA